MDRRGDEERAHLGWREGEENNGGGGGGGAGPAGRRRWAMEGDDGWRERETQRQRATWRALMPLVLMLTIIRSSAPRNNSSYRGRTGGLDDSSWGAGGAHYAPNSVTLSKWGTNSSQHAKFAAALQTGRAGGAFDGKASEDHGHERGVGAGRVSPGGAWHREGESSRGEALTFGEEWEDEEREKKRASSSWGKVSTAGGDHDGEGDGGAAREAGEVYDDGSDDEEGRYPARITGLFRGEWEVMDREAMKGAASGFENTRGTVVMQVCAPFLGTYRPASVNPALGAHNISRRRFPSAVPVNTVPQHLSLLSADS